MNILVLTIHNPAFSMGPHIRLESFLRAGQTEQSPDLINEPKSPLSFIIPKFSKKNSKLETLKVLLNLKLYVLKNYKKIDLIHVVTPPSYPGLIAVFAKKFLKVPYIVDVGDPCAENLASAKGWRHDSFKFKFFKKLDNYIYKHANHLILTSPILKDYTPNNKPSTTLLTAIAKKSDFVQTNLPHNKKCVFTGNFGPLQNLKYIVEVFAEAIKKDPEISLDIVGSGDKTQFEEILNRPEIKGKIQLKSPIPPEEIKSLLRAYSLGIISLDLKPTLDYAVPTKLLTYLGNGLPVFGPAGTAVRSIVHNSETGHIISDYNIERDAKKLIEILNNHSSLQSSSAKATLYAQENLSLESFSKKALEIYSATL